MENLKNKNVIISVLAGILIIFGAFFSSKNSTSSQAGIGAEVAYDKSATIDDQSKGSPADANSSDELKVDVYTNTKPHSQIELATTADGSRAGSKAYGLELAKILGQYQTSNSINPVELTNSMYETQNYSKVKQLTSLQTNYKKEIVNLLAIKAPKDISATHLNLINNLDRMSQLLGNMAGIETDQLTAIASARQFVEEVNIQVLLFREINKYFTDKNISFGSTEKASVYAGITN